MSQASDTAPSAGWDAFLTSADQALLAQTSWAKGEPFGFGQRPAVLVVDAYYGALGLPRQAMLRAVRDWPAACGETGWAAVDRTASLLDKVRAKSVPVVYLTGLRANPNPWNRKRRAETAGPPRHPHSLTIVEELAPHQDDLVLEKCSPSGFTTTPLHLL